MLAKHQRVPRPEFAHAFARGERRHTPLFTVVVLAGEGNKAAVVVSKKVAKKAHDRNRIRRRMYAVLAPFITKEANLGTVLILAKPALASLTKAEFFTQVPREIAESLRTK